MLALSIVIPLQYDWQFENPKFRILWLCVKPISSQKAANLEAFSDLFGSPKLLTSLARHAYVSFQIRATVTKLKLDIHVVDISNQVSDAENFA